jgi:hypothetical protein
MQTLRRRENTALRKKGLHNLNLRNFGCYQESAHLRKEWAYLKNVFIWGAQLFMKTSHPSTSNIVGRRVLEEASNMRTNCRFIAHTVLSIRALSIGVLSIGSAALFVGTAQARMTDTIETGPSLDCIEAKAVIGPAGRSASLVRPCDEAALSQPARPLPQPELQTVPSSQIMDGTYVARSGRGCGEKPVSFTLEIRSGRISWTHDFQGIAYQWAGTIDASGVIHANVGNNDVFSAAGQYRDDGRRVEIHYPQCGTESIRIDIQQRTR